MKKRQSELIRWILRSPGLPFETVLEKLKISKRTLYYDIEEINYSLRHCAQLKKVAGQLVMVGDLQRVSQMLANQELTQQGTEEKLEFILYKILCDDFPRQEQMEQKLQISHSTMTYLMNELRDQLDAQGIELRYDEGTYQIRGDENQIRDRFLYCLYNDNNLINRISDEILSFNQKNELGLADYSMALLSAMLRFIRLRMARQCRIRSDWTQETQAFRYRQSVAEDLNIADPLEAAYLTAFISSLTTLDAGEKQTIVDQGVTRLITCFESRMAVVIEDREMIRRSIAQHLLASYYRIQFQFPIRNFCLDEIKSRYFELFTMIRLILEDEQIFPEFKGIREEEIAFLTAYFGGVLRSQENHRRMRSRILLVCPQGLMVSKMLQIQIEQSVPLIQIVDQVSLQRLPQITAAYDYIVSTMPIAGYDDKLIQVNPLLNRQDVCLLMEKCTGISMPESVPEVQPLLQIIEKYCEIQNRPALVRELEALLYKHKEERGSPMLKELITSDKIRILNHVDSWQSAIAEAAQPLVLDGSIDPEYIQEMIASIEKYGPYIVLADRFALPHASGALHVHRLGMAILSVKEAVDLLGKPVNLFAVLATVDSTSHIRALAELTEILYDQANIDKLCQGSAEEILRLIRQDES